MALFRSLGLGLAAATIGVTAFALECPMPQSVARPGVLDEPEAVIAAMAPALAAPGASQRAPDLIAQVRARYPAAGPAEIVNFLITAYCPVAVAQGASEADPQALIEAFASAVTQALY